MSLHVVLSRQWLYSLRGTHCVNPANHAESALPVNRAMVFVSSLIVASFLRVIV